MMDADCEEHASDRIDLVIRARDRDLGGGFMVRRTLPAMRRRRVGPFVFFDHMGPVDLPAGQGQDVRPHPHIALATVTYLFEGAVMHRDSLGTAKEIHPGDVNWMVAGKGIVHSERTPPDVRARGHRTHGIQAWVALRKDEEDVEPSFVHHPKSTPPVVTEPGVEIRLISGNAFGASAPGVIATPTIYADVRLAKGASLSLPDGYEERAVYVVSGTIGCESSAFETGAMVIFRAGAEVKIEARADAHVMLLGGAPLDGDRHIWWNFVASDKAKIETAKQDWREGRFPKVPGDDVEFIPLPES